MAGHSHWAGIKHKKGRADKIRSKEFSKLSREITVAAKLGDKNPEMNPRLRAAIQSARSANMPKDNIDRAIDKSDAGDQSNFESIRYEGFGPKNIAVIVDTLKNSSAALCLSYDISLTGKDLIEFGWTPGPNLGETLNSVQDLQLEGTLNSKEEALEWVKANRSKK